MENLSKTYYAMSNSDLYTITDAGSVPTMESFVTGEVTKSHTLSEYSTMELNHNLSGEKKQFSKLGVSQEPIGEPLIDLGIIDKEVQRYQEALNQQLQYDGN